MHLYNKTYGLEPPGKAVCDGKPLPPCHAIYNHSPDGFSWGYQGSGPAQLALAVMVNEFGPKLTEHPIHYQDLKRDFIGKLEPDSPHEFTTLDVVNHIRAIKLNHIQQ